MTAKQEFLDKLSAALAKRNISEDDMRPYIERFDQLYDKMTEGTAQVSDPLENVESAADTIAAQITERYEEINRLAERTMTMDAVEVCDTVPDNGDVPEIDSEPTVTTDIAPIAEAAEEYGGYELAEEPDLQPLIPAELSSEGEQVDPALIPEGTTRLPDYVEKEVIPNSKLFWILFAVTLPITVPLGLVIVGAFVILWAAIIGLIAGSLAAMVAVSAVGAILALVGIISGIIQLFSVTPIGIYEIGMGVAAGGCAMLVAILLYNFAVRLMPFLIKKVWQLFVFVIKKLKKLFNFLRKECAKL